MTVKTFGAPPKRTLKATERFQLGVRVTGQNKQRLDAAADQFGRSQSHEAERRIERSFEYEDAISQGLSLAYGRRVAGLAQMLASAMLHSGVNTLVSKGGGPLAEVIDHTRWMDDPDAYEQAMRGVAAVLERFRPTGEIS